MSVIFVIVGLLPLVGVSVFNIVKRARILAPVIALCASTAVVAIVGVTSPMLFKPDNKNLELSEGDLGFLANTQISVGDSIKAKEYIHKLSSDNGDTLSGLLAEFRMAVVNGDYYLATRNAKILSMYLADNKESISKSEKKMVDAFVKGEDLPDKDEAKEKVLDIIDDELDTYEDKHEYASDFGKALKVASKLNATSNTSKEYEDIAEDLRDIYEENPTVFGLDEVNEAYIVALVYADEKEELVKYAFETEDAKAVAAVANLYMNEGIKDRYFEDYVKDDGAYDAVVERIDSIVYDLDEDKYSKATIKQYEEKLEAIENMNDKPVLAKLEEILVPENEKDEDKAAAYIQDAGINSTLLNASEAKAELKKAVEYSDSSNNATLKKSLSDIGSVISGEAVNNISSLQNDITSAYIASSVLPGNNVKVPESLIENGNAAANENRATINVGIVDCEKFPKIKAYVSTSGIDLTKKENVTLVDAGCEITDFEIEKVNYDSARIFLICDNSGSMSGSIEGLKQAVTKFVETKTKKESISVITFDSSVLSNSGLLKDKEDLIDEVEQFAARGGTNIKSGVDAAFGDVKNDKDVLTVFVVMTDGIDSSYSNESALNALRVTCMENNVVLYTIGLGSVSGEYLQKVADSGMGSFIYGSDAVQLEGLYEFIHNQLDENYLITFTAKNTTDKYDRVLEVRENTTGYLGKRTYSLDYEKGSDGSSLPSGSTGRIKPNGSSAKVTGYGTSYVIGYKYATKPFKFTVLGEGFKNTKSIKVSLEGETNVANLSVIVKDDKTLEVSIPAATAFGTYTSVITIDGVEFRLEGLRYVSASGALMSVSFGEYTFEAYDIAYDKNTTTLSGNATMNGYLKFNGDIKLLGNLEGNSIELVDEVGSCIKYKSKMAGLLGEYFEDKASIAPFDGINLYKDGKTYDKYSPDTVSYGMINMSSPQTELHKDGVTVYLVNYNIDLPLLNNLFDAKDLPFSGMLKNSEKVILGDKKIDVDLTITSDAVDFARTMYFGKLKLSPLDYEIGINTKENNYTFEIKSDAHGIPGIDGDEISGHINFANGYFDEIGFGVDHSVDVVMTPTTPPLTVVSLSDFKFAIANLSKNADSKNLISRILNGTLKGGCDIDVVNLKEIIPGLDGLLGDILDISVLKCDDTTVEITPLEFNYKFSTTAQLFEMVSLGKVTAELGSYSFSNAILGVSNESALGMYVKAETAVNLDFGNDFNINVDGSERIDVSTAFLGLHANGKANYNLKFFKKFKGDLNGDVLIGVKDLRFVIYVKGDDYSRGDDIGFRIVVDGNDIWDSEIECY